MTEQQRAQAKRAADAMLAADGFVDVERNHHGVRLTDAALDASVDVAEHWRAVGRAVAELPADYPLRAFLEHWAQTGAVVPSAQATGVSRWQAREAVRRFNIRRRRVQ